MLDLNASQQFIQINLNGYVHSDDRLAVSEIYHALMCRGESEDSSMTVSNHLFDVLEIFRQGTRENVPLLIVLEEFDLFAGHGRQNLLYNLFDACQSKQHPMVVIGLSCRMVIQFDPFINNNSIYLL